MSKNQLIPWSSPVLTPIDFNEKQPRVAIVHAHCLKKHEQEMIITAIASGIPQMAADFIWKKAMNRLIRFLGSFGSQFIGEMLDRQDITEGDDLETRITHSDAITLAGELGLIGKEGIIRLRQNLELIRHFDDEAAEGTYKKIDVHSIVSNSIEYILQQPDTAPQALDFKSFRDKALSESFTEASDEIQTLINSPYFFQRTAVKVILSGIKSLAGAKRQHVLVNAHVTIPLVWPNLSEEDKYSVGRAYSELSSSGDSEAVKSLKMSLSKVKGFDYVPENVRSNTFKTAAQAVIAAHNGFNNFHLELGPTKELAKLGTTIPKPALAECMRAYLCVFLGNQYGYSHESAPIAELELKRIPTDNWYYYITKILPKDREVLWELRSEKPAKRLTELFTVMTIPDLDDLSKLDIVKRMATAIATGKPDKIREAANGLLKILM